MLPFKFCKSCIDIESVNHSLERPTVFFSNLLDSPENPLAPKVHRGDGGNAYLGSVVIIVIDLTAEA